MYLAYKRAQDLGHDAASNPNWIAAIREAANTQFEGAGREIIVRIADTLEQANPDGPLDALVTPLQAIFSDASSNPELANSSACVVASVAYRSSQFWPEVTIADTGTRFPDPRTLIHIVCADIVGAIAGAGTGAGIGAGAGLDPGTIIDLTIIFGVLGGAAASGYTASEPPSGGGGGH